MRTIADEYLETRPTLRAAIESFDKKRRGSLLRRLQKEEDAITFFSTLAEAQVGLFFDPACSELQYNHLLGGKRPDWLLTMNGQTVLCEVLRLNTPKEEARAGIERSRQLRRYQIANLGVPIVIHGEAKVIDMAYLCGCQWKLQLKEEKYRTIIERRQLPYIVCVNPSIDTYINQVDLRDFLMGKWGFFATKGDFGRNVTGILLQSFFGEWVYFPNERAQFPLTEENARLMRTWEL